MTVQRAITTTRYCIWALPVFLVLWIANADLAFTGSLVLRCSATRCDPRIKNFAAREPVILTGRQKNSLDQFRAITADPLSFDVTIARPMESATVRLRYQDPTGQEWITLNTSQRYGPVHSMNFAAQAPIFGTLEGTWHQTHDGDLTLFRRPSDALKTFMTVDDLLRAIPSGKRIATFGTNLSYRLTLPNYAPSNVETVTTLNLHGSMDFLVYAGDGEPFDATLTVLDRNRTSGKNSLRAELFWGTTSLAKVTLQDDGNDTGDDQAGVRRTVHLSSTNAHSGIYRIVVTPSSDDLIVQDIAMKQHLFLIDRTLRTATASPVTLYVKGGTLTVQARAADGVGRVQVGSRNFQLSTVDHVITVPLRANTLTPVTLTGDVMLTTDGVFSVTKQAYFQHDMMNIDAIGPAGDLSRYDYVVAQYPVVRTDGSWTVAEQTIKDLPKSRTVHYSFSFNPTLSSVHQPFRLKELTIRLHGKPLTPGTTFDLAKKMIKKLRSGEL